MAVWRSLLAFSSLLLAARVAVAAPGLTGALYVDKVGQPDPCIFFDEASSTYYTYADDGRLLSSSQVESGWKPQPSFEVKTPSGANYTKGIGAPSVAFLDGKYVLYFSASEKIFVATSSSPEGPFVLESTPLLVPGTQPSGVSNGKIAFPAAPAIFQHEGNNYMLYKYGRAADYNGVSAMCIREISADGLTATGEPYELFTVTNGSEQDGRQFTEDEGPNMVYNNGTFYLFFNAGTWCDADYQIVYATGTSLTPSSPYKYQGVFLETSPPEYDGVSLKAPGGISFVDSNTFIFMSNLPDANLSCSTKPHPPRYIHAGQLTYESHNTVSVATSWST